MSLTVIGLGGALVGFICVAAGVFMEDAHSTNVTHIIKRKPARRNQPRLVRGRRRAA